MARWTEKEFDTARKLRAEGMSCEEIGARLNRSRGSVGKRLQGVWDGPRGGDWTPEQVEHLTANLKTPAALLLLPLAELGPHRSLTAIRSKKREFYDAPRLRRVTRRPDEMPWPALKGSHEERDAQFAIRVIEAKHFCGLIQDRRLVELMIDDVTRGLQRRKAAA